MRDNTGSRYRQAGRSFRDAAQNAGCRLPKQQSPRNEGRNLERVEIEAVVTGSYAGVVRFLNGLQHSNNVYAVAALQAKGDEGQQAVKVTKVYKKSVELMFPAENAHVRYLEEAVAPPAASDTTVMWSIRYLVEKEKDV